MKKSVIILLHIGFWVCYLILIAIMLVVYSKSGSNIINQGARVKNAFYSIFCFAFVPSFISFYLFYFLLFPKYLQQKKFFLSIIYGLLNSVGAAIIGYILIRYFIETGHIIDMNEGGRKGRSTAFSVIMVITFISSICGIITLVLKGLITQVIYNQNLLKKDFNYFLQNIEIALLAKIGGIPWRLNCSSID